MFIHNRRKNSTKNDISYQGMTAVYSKNSLMTLVLLEKKLQNNKHGMYLHHVQIPKFQQLHLTVNALKRKSFFSSVAIDIISVIVHSTDLSRMQFNPVLPTTNTRY